MRNTAFTAHNFNTFSIMWSANDPRWSVIFNEKVCEYFIVSDDLEKKELLQLLIKVSFPWGVVCEVTESKTSRIYPYQVSTDSSLWPTTRIKIYWHTSFQGTHDGYWYKNAAFWKNCTLHVVTELFSASILCWKYCKHTIHKQSVLEIQSEQLFDT